jgi:hypothetical protein
MKPVKYYEFFQQSKLQNFESTTQIVDSIMRYESLVNYRMRISANDNYWFLANLLDDTLQLYDFFYIRRIQGKRLGAQYLISILSEFKTAINKEYPTRKDVNRVIIVRDTLKLIDIWLEALTKMSVESNFDVTLDETSYK